MDNTKVAQEVLGILSAEGVALSEDVGEAQRMIRERMLAIGREALRLHLEGKKLGYGGPHQSCPCGQRQKFVGYRGKAIVTLLGEVRLNRAYYHCRHCGKSSLPYDQQAGLGSAAASPGVAKAACLLGIEIPFGQAAQMLWELAGIRLSESTVGRLTGRAGAKADALEREEAQRMEQWKSPPEAPVAGRLYNSADGTMVHTLKKWQEVKTQVCYWKDAQGKHQARYRSRLEGIEEFVGHAWALASRWGLEKCRQSVLIGDGAAWIWERLGPIFDESIQIVDWYHAAEHLWSCGKALHGEATEACRVWVEAKKSLLWQGRRARLLEELQAEHDRVRAKNKRAALGGLMTYVKNQGARLDYPRFRDQGLDIGSGTVESACRHVVQSRMKRAGTRWSISRAQAVMSLRCCRLNSQWDTFWNARPLAA
jgi:hypothetical protein